jgi:hypothetical protein
LPKRSNSTTVGSTNRLIDDELGYDVAKLSHESDAMISKLNDEQLHAFKCIVDVVFSENLEFFFVSGYGGTRKTFLWNTIIAYFRANKKIVLPVASYGVASLLLPGGRTPHSRFRIPCDDLDETTTCNIKWGTVLFEFIQASSLIIWDEALMTNKIAFEDLDRTLRDVVTISLSQKNKLPFGGKVVVLGGDLRQTLPIIDCVSRSQIISSAIVNSALWAHVIVLHHRKNMRLVASTLMDECRMELAAFSKWMLDIGEGNIESTAKFGESEPSWIEIPEEYILRTSGNKASCIVDAVYPNLAENYMDLTYLKEHAILTPTNDIVDTINNHVVSLIPSDEKQYLSCDSIAKTPNTHDSYDLLCPVEFLNSLNENNFPQHKLSLKKGVPIMLLRNLNQAEGL